MEKQKLARRKARIIKAAIKAIQERPRDLEFILAELYEVAQSDYETAYMTHDMVEGDGSARYCRCELERYNPKMY